MFMCNPGPRRSQPFLQGAKDLQFALASVRNLVALKDVLHGQGCTVECERRRGLSGLAGDKVSLSYWWHSRRV